MDKIAPDKSTEERILQAAKKVFVAKGMAGARMQDIANEAGINKALLHYYFRSKEKLFEVIFKSAFSKFMPQVDIILNSDEALFTKIEKLCSTYIDNLLENPFIPLFVIDEMNKQPAELIERVWGEEKPNPLIFFQQVKAEIEKGNIRHIEPRQLFVNMISLIIFPYLATPMLRLRMGLDNEQLKEFMEARKSEVSQFIINSIKI